MIDCRVAAVQTGATDDRDANLARAGELVAQAVAEGAQLVVLPERFAHYGPQAKVLFEPDDGPTASFLAEQAARHGVHVAGGATLVASEGKGTNTLLLYGPDGARLGRYDKIHLFKVELDDLRIDESIAYDRGSAPVVVDTALGKIGLTICYDLRFPELYRELTARGAEIVLVPAAFTVPTGRAHWRLLLRARAVENQVFVVAADQGGQHAGVAPPSYGHSAIVDPWGDVVAGLDHDAPGVAVGALEAAWLADVRGRIPCLAHRVL